MRRSRENQRQSERFERGVPNWTRLAYLHTGPRRVNGRNQRPDTRRQPTALPNPLKPLASIGASTHDGLGRAGPARDPAGRRQTAGTTAHRRDRPAHRFHLPNQRTAGRRGSDLIGRPLPLDQRRAKLGVRMAAPGSLPVPGRVVWVAHPGRRRRGHAEHARDRRVVLAPRQPQHHRGLSLARHPRGHPGPSPSPLSSSPSLPAEVDRFRVVRPAAEGNAAPPDFPCAT